MESVKNGLMERDVFSLLLFNFVLECAIRKFYVNQVGLKLNDAYQFLVSADDVNVLGRSIRTVKKNRRSINSC
jgi:hypothetical protein